MLMFDDGEQFDTSGPLRIECRSDGWYVLGEGLLVPAGGREDAKRLLAELRGGADDDVEA
jgi:hypothetical protein